MAENIDQLGNLGQRVIDQVTKAYDPSNQETVALAMHPGQLVGRDFGSEWLAQYDYPLLLKLSDGTRISTSISGGVSAKSAYLDCIPWASPTFPPDSPAWNRMNAIIRGARTDLGGNPQA